MKTVLMRPLFAAAALGVAACSPPAPAAMSTLDGDWTVDSGASRFSFVSVKAGTLAEAHTFSGLMGTVMANGDAEIEIPLSSVETLRVFTLCLSGFYKGLSRFHKVS